MKILQVIPTFGMGGAETMCAGLCRQLHSLGEEVVAVSLSGEQTALTRQIEAAGIPVRYLNKSLGLDPGCIGRLKKVIRQEQPQIVHTHLHALKYAALAGPGAPIVHTVHNEAAQEAVFLDQKIGKYLFRRGLATPVALTREIQKSVTDLYGVTEVPLVPNGIDLSRCQEKSDYTLHYPIELLHIGRFYPQKNHAVLLEAAEFLKKRGVPIRIRCYGDGPLLEEIRQKAAQMNLGNTVRFEGVTEDVFPCLSQADLFLLPSSWEGMPMTVIEAMGTGLPVVAARVGGIPDMLTDGESGVLIEPNAKALADAVQKLIQDEALRQALGQNARQAAQRFSLDTMTQGYLALYQKLLEGKA